MNRQQGLRIENLTSQIDLLNQITENNLGAVSKTAKLKLIQNNTSATSAAIRHILKTKIFPSVKFASVRQLKSIIEGSIGWTVMNELQLPKEYFAEFWAVHYVTADLEFVKHRTQLTANARKSFEKGELHKY